MIAADEIALRELCARVPGPHTAATAAARARVERLARPTGSLGALEPLILRLAGCTGQSRPDLARPALLVAAGDHGVVAERISPLPQASTAQSVLSFLRGAGAINALAGNAGARLVLADAGVAAELPDHPRLRRVALGRGTANLLRGPAMPRSAATGALLAGARIVDAEAATGLDLLGLGEVGVGNTTAAACLTSIFTGVAPELTTGPGRGLDDAQLQHKRAVVAGALRRARAKPSDPVGALAELGGFEIALLAGAAIAAAARRIPVLLDSYVTASAALVAVALAPNLRHCLIAAHCSPEPGHRVALEFLRLQPLLTLGLSLGEGSGAALALPVIFGAARLMRDVAPAE